MGRLSAVSAGLTALVLAFSSGSDPSGRPPPIRAAYFYHYMGAAHLDSLRARGFDRAVIHWIPDALGPEGALELRAFVARGESLGIEVVPQWSFQGLSRLSARPADLRYVWGSGRVESEIPCPLDSLYWRSALIGRSDEVFGASPGFRRVAIDLELFRGGRHHYDAGPCRCARCLALYGGGRPLGRVHSSGLLGFEEARLQRVLTGLLREWGASHPGAELGVFDLDYDSFVHRAFARALAAADLACADYCERSYASGGEALIAARTRLEALGLSRAALIGGLWLQRWDPRDLPEAARGVATHADGYFVFTTFSLWMAPARLQGPYTLPATQAETWRALALANQP